MSRIMIIGAGQSGLQLGMGLLDHGHEVTVVSNRTPEQIREGRVMSSQCMFDAALQHERDISANFWEDSCPPVEGISFTVPDGQGGKQLEWAGRLDRDAQSVDQRVKMPVWMQELERRGGELRIEEAGIEELEAYARDYDLVLVASGKGEIGKLFERDAERSTFDKPQRALALTYVHGMTPRPEHSAVCFNLIPGVGEYFVFPALTLSGPCEIMVFEGVPGGPMDCWGDVDGPAAHLARSLEILETYLPWEAARCRNVELTDDQGILAGRFPPTIRKPVGRLPSGAAVLGMADTVVLNDPVTGQGSNNAAKCAATYLQRILERGDGPFDSEWMQGTFETYWDYARYVVDWTNALLQPPQPHVLELMGAAQGNRELARRMANGFNDPRDYFPWFMEPGAADEYLKSLQAA
ncbi:styrene monooxygenase/indole monooxygenase family protein [Arhodomonas sp. SL1]|uniref:styrene monooxygenase/indole monooxygenase family protein n=1 Tax=Arhodomonas sp. SL1 TaxID=3425691 RepID=UPI003F88488D